MVFKSEKWWFGYFWPYNICECGDGMMDKGNYSVCDILGWTQDFVHVSDWSTTELHFQLEYTFVLGSPFKLLSVFLFQLSKSGLQVWATTHTLLFKSVCLGVYFLRFSPMWANTALISEIVGIYIGHWIITGFSYCPRINVD